MRLVSLFNSKLFYAEAQFSLVDLSPTRKYPREDVDIYMSADFMRGYRLL